MTNQQTTQFRLWWATLDPYPNDDTLRWFPVGPGGDKLAVSKIGMVALWESMCPFWREHYRLREGAIYGDQDGNRYRVYSMAGEYCMVQREFLEQRHAEFPEHGRTIRYVWGSLFRLEPSAIYQLTEVPKYQLHDHHTVYKTHPESKNEDTKISS